MVFINGAYILRSVHGRDAETLQKGDLVNLFKGSILSLSTQLIYMYMFALVCCKSLHTQLIDLSPMHVCACALTSHTCLHACLHAAAGKEYGGAGLLTFVHYVGIQLTTSIELISGVECLLDDLCLRCQVFTIAKYNFLTDYVWDIGGPRVKYVQNIGGLRVKQVLDIGGQEKNMCLFIFCSQGCPKVSMKGSNYK